MIDIRLVEFEERRIRDGPVEFSQIVVLGEQ